MKAILWDLDDTLLETLPGRMKALEHAYRACVGGSVDPLALWRSHRGGSLEALGERLMGADGPRFVKTYRDYYYALPRAARAFEGVTDVLDSFVHASLPMAVVTAKISWGAVDELSAAGLLGYFAAVVGADDTDLHKPHPDPIYEAMSRLVVDEPRDVMFVGDSPADVGAARNAGCMAVAATWGTLDEELLLDAGPEFVARRPADVLEVLTAARGVLR